MYNMDELMGFVEWLPNNSELFADLDVEATIAQINKLASSDEGKETLEQLTKQYKSKEMGLFKKGGKLDYLLCLKKGGKVQDCGCGKKIEKAATGSSGVSDGDWDDYHTIINAPGDTLRFKQYFSGPAYMRTHPEGGVTYERSTRDGVTRMYDENYQPSGYEVNILGMTPVTADEKENWKQLIKNHANDPAVKDKTKKKTKTSTSPILSLFRGLNAPSIDYSQQMFKKGGVLFAKNGSELGSATYEIKKGDNLIKIARQFGLNSLDEILALNPQIKNPNMIYEGQTLNLPKDKMKQNGNLESSSISGKMPNYDRVAYANLPASVKEKVDAYSQAIRDHKIKYTDVPALYRQQAYNQSIRGATDEAAPMVLTKVGLAPWTIPDTIIRGGLNEARKALNGRDDTEDYGVGDYFTGNFSWLGKDFQEEHPIADAIINTATTPVVMAGAENIAARAMDGTLSGTMARASANAKATARTMGVEPEPITVEYTMGKTGGHSYKGPGAGRAHTRGSVNNASYRQVPISSKVVDPMNFVENPAASGFTGTGYWHGFPAVLPEQEKPNYVIVEPEKEYTEETIVNKNPWIYNTDTPDAVVPYRPGDETITYVIGQAKRGNSPKEQSITKESIETGKGNPRPGVKVKKGEAVGSTPSGYYSGFGYTYGTEGGPWLTYQKGGILNKHKK